MPGVKVVFGVDVTAGVSAVAVALVGIVVTVELIGDVAVGVTCWPAQAVVISTTNVKTLNKDRREIFFIFSPYLKSFTSMTMHA